MTCFIQKHAVELFKQAEQREMVVLGRVGRQLDDRRSAVEDLAAAIEHEVVVRGDVGEGDGQRRSKLVSSENIAYSPPRPSVSRYVSPKIDDLPRESF